MKDEILAELWAIKDRIGKETNHDLKALFERNGLTALSEEEDADPGLSWFRLRRGEDE